jgi:hypothetical protein
MEKRTNRLADDIAILREMRSHHDSNEITFLIDYIAKQYYGTQSYHNNLKEFIPNRSVLEEKKLQENQVFDILHNHI